MSTSLESRWAARCGVGAATGRVVIALHNKGGGIGMSKLNGVLGKCAPTEAIGFSR